MQLPLPNGLLLPRHGGSGMNTERSHRSTPRLRPTPSSPAYSLFCSLPSDLRPVSALVPTFLACNINQQLQQQGSAQSLGSASLLFMGSASLLPQAAPCYSERGEQKRWDELCSAGRQAVRIQNERRAQAAALQVQAAQGQLAPCTSMYCPLEAS